MTGPGDYEGVTQGTAPYRGDDEYVMAGLGIGHDVTLIAHGRPVGIVRIEGRPTAIVVDGARFARVSDATYELVGPS